MWLIVGDLHLTDNARDAYRFGIFDWIKKQQAKRPVAATFLLGDITENKDRHSATLVNKIVAGLTSLQPPVYILKGNHDYSDPNNPFFKFLNYIDGITFVVKPKMIRANRTIAMIPHCREQSNFDYCVSLCAHNEHKAAAFLVHQTFEGAIAESGVRLSGLSGSHIEVLKPKLGVYAGDVHRPQTQGIVTYVGCPYHVRFGDNFDPRSFWVGEDGHRRQLYYSAPRKWALTVRGPENILNNNELYQEDQVKLTIQLVREEAVEWKKIRQQVLQACKELKLNVYGVKLEILSNTQGRSKRIENKDSNTSSVFEFFCKTEPMSSKIKSKGMEIINVDKDCV